LGTISKGAIQGWNVIQKPPLMFPTVARAKQFPAKARYGRGPYAHEGGDPNIREQPDGRKPRPREVYRDVVIEREKDLPFHSLVEERAGGDDHGPQMPVQYGDESSETQDLNHMSGRYVDPVKMSRWHTSYSKRSHGATDSIQHEQTQSPLVDDLLQRIFELEEENSQLKAHADGAPVELIKPHASLEPKWKTLYRIDRSNIYLDEPRWVLGDRKRPYMKAEMSVHNLAFFIERNPDIAFIVYKEYNSKARVNKSAFSEASNGISGAPEAYAGSLSFVSDDMKRAMEQMINQVPDFIRYFPGFKVSDDVAAPYLFMYYTRQYWDECQSGLSTQSQRLLGLLKQCIMESYGAEYEAADGAFADCLVSRRYIKYLVCPGDVLVMMKGSQISAFMSLNWIGEIDHYAEGRDADRPDHPRVAIQRPWEEDSNQSEIYHLPSSSPSHISIQETSSFSYWSVEAWSWEFDGSFGKNKRPIEIELPTYEEDQLVQINSLAGYPVRFAENEVKDRLEGRGKTFWSCRQKQLVSYHVEADEGLSAVSLLRYP
jgi:hypothetical protein